MRKLRVDSTLFIFWMVELEKRREIQKEKQTSKGRIQTVFSLRLARR